MTETANLDRAGSAVELMSDGDGVCVIGPTSEVDAFLVSRGLVATDMKLHRLESKLAAGSAGVLQAGSEITANSGRWIKLTKDSAKALHDLPPMKGSSSEVARAVVTDKGKIKGILEFVRTPGSMLTNPAMLAGAAGIAAQLAMQQTMDEITDYLAVIDAKVDDVLRAQKDAALADMIGVDFVIEEAMTIREQVGFVSEVTWSKVQATTATVARTQAYALRQLDAMAEKIERTSKVGDLADLAKTAESSVQEWLAVLAHCFRLQDATAVLEIDRVLDASSTNAGEVDRHRQALNTARDNRRRLIVRSTQQLMERMDAAAARANTKVLLSPLAARDVVRATNEVAGDITAFHTPLGLGEGREDLEARRWGAAAVEARDDVLEAGKGGIEAVGRIGGEALENARMSAGRFAGRLADRLQRKGGDESDEAGSRAGE